MQPCSTEISLDCEVKKCERNEVRRNQHSIRCCHLPIPLTFRYIHFEFFQIRIFACLNCYYWELASRTPVKLSTQRKQVLQCNGLYARACYISCTTNRNGWSAICTWMQECLCKSARSVRKSRSVITASRPSVTGSCCIACPRRLCEGCKEFAACMHHSLECESSGMPNSVLCHTYLHSTMLDVPYVFREALLASQHTFESTLLEITQQVLNLPVVNDGYCPWGLRGSCY